MVSPPSEVNPRRDLIWNRCDVRFRPIDRSFPHADVLAATAPLRRASIVFSSCACVLFFDDDCVDAVTRVRCNMARLMVNTNVARLYSVFSDAGLRRYGAEACLQEELGRDDSSDPRLALDLRRRLRRHDSWRIGLRASSSVEAS